MTNVGLFQACKDGSIAANLVKPTDVELTI